MYTAPVVKKAFRILRLILEKNRPLNVTEISRHLSISKSTTYGILKALEEEQLVLKDRGTKKYVVGKGLMELSKKVFRWFELTRVAKPLMEDLVKKVDETAFLGIKEGEKVRVIDVVEAHKELKVSPKVDTLFPITASAFLKLYLSKFDISEAKDIIKEMRIPKYTENTITDCEKLIPEIQKTQDQGFSVDREEYIKGIVACAALVPNVANYIVILCVLGFANSLTDEKLIWVGRTLKDIALSISERMQILNGQNRS
ncbi:MAG: IclR family transcriptional regulator [Desulfobacterota bacterium]|nr:IclR family transcriptional regulator [Thermodesulfobacteriota bacterium]MDW8001099.1 IclR family transcriptional regulator [Deltaproteobacteria bacterium]